MIPHKIFVAVVDHTDRGQLFNAWYNGELVAARTTQPFFDACRVLAARGLTGPAEMWGRQCYARMKGTIEGCARLTVEDRDRGGLRLRPWKPSPFALSRVAESAVDGKVEGGR